MEKPIIFLCVYLPCRGTETTLDFQQILDELSEIIIKYRNYADIVLGGDMNASLNRNSKQDRIFKHFIDENNLQVPKSCGSNFTFYHYNGKDVPQIFYKAEI